MSQQELVATRAAVDLITELPTVEEIVAHSANELQNLLHAFDSGKSDGRVPGESIGGDDLAPWRMHAEVLDRCSAVGVEPRCVEVERLAERDPVWSRPLEVAGHETGSFQGEFESRERQEELEQQIMVECDIF
jgi:hypothetical protein